MTTQPPDPHLRDPRGADPTIIAGRCNRSTRPGASSASSRTRPLVPACFGNLDLQSYYCLHRCRWWHKCAEKRLQAARLRLDLKH